MRQQRSFPHSAASVGDARHFAAEILSERPDGEREVTLLLISELATNAIVHAETGFSVGIDTGKEALQVEVSDSGDGMPTLRSPGALDPIGRGLRIVERLADDWGVKWEGRRGKTVWFALSATPGNAGTV